MSEQPLKILQLNRRDQYGGAERFAWNLHTTYRQLGHESWFVVDRKDTADPHVQLIASPREKSMRWTAPLWVASNALEHFEDQVRGTWRLRRQLEKIARIQPRHNLERAAGLDNLYRPTSHTILDRLNLAPDIIHVHNLHQWFDLRALVPLSQKAPVVMMLHDMWTLTGHCGHAFDCTNWQTGCGHCPDLTIFPAISRDATAYNWRQKQNVYKQSHIHVVTYSDWLMEKVNRSMLGRHAQSTRVIRPGIDLDVFKPADQKIARRELNIPENHRVLMFAATGMRRNIFKDYKTLRHAVEQVSKRSTDKNLLFLAVGENSPSEWIGETEIRFVPYQDSIQKMARLYQASDLYLHAARGEVWGLTITESLACGTPVVVTAVGGIPEQVKGLSLPGTDANWSHNGPDNATGVVVSKGDAETMTKAIIHLLNDDQLHVQLGDNATIDAHKRFDKTRQAREFLDLYRTILETV